MAEIPDRQTTYPKNFTYGRPSAGERPRLSEIADINQEGYALLCEESYDSRMSLRLSGRQTALIDVLRTQNIYPISVYARLLPNRYIELYDSEAQDSSSCCSMIRLPACLRAFTPPLLSF